MQIPLCDRPGDPDHLSKDSTGPQLWGVTKWVLLEAARLYALPELLFSLCKYYPFSSGQISCAENRFLSGPETEIATCFPLKAPKQLNRIPVFRPHRKRKSGFPAEPETEMRALQSPRDRKRNRWRLCTSFSHQMNRKRKWWLYWLANSYWPRDKLLLTISL